MATKSVYDLGRSVARAYCTGPAARRAASWGSEDAPDYAKCRRAPIAPARRGRDQTCVTQLFSSPPARVFSQPGDAST